MIGGVRVRIRVKIVFLRNLGGITLTTFFLACLNSCDPYPSVKKLGREDQINIAAINNSESLKAPYTESHSNSSIQHEPALALHNLSLSSLADSHTRPASNNLYDNLKSLNPPTLRNNNVQKFVPSYKHSDQSGVPSSGVLEGRAPPKLRLELGRVYKPEDIAQYILDTGDEKGIAQVVAEMVEDGRVKQSTDDVLQFLQEVQRLLELRQGRPTPNYRQTRTSP